MPMNNSNASNARKGVAQIVVHADVVGEELQHKGAGLLVPYGKADLFSTERDADLLQPLGVKWVRHRLNTLLSNTHRTPGAQYVVMLSSGWYPWQRETPWDDDYAAWDEYVMSQIRLARQHGVDMIWDIWNEPEGKYFVDDDKFLRNQKRMREVDRIWPRVSWDRYFEIYLRTFNLIRAHDSSAQITGPEIGVGTLPIPIIEEYFKAFHDFCSENDCLPDYWSFHYPQQRLEQIVDILEALKIDDLKILVTEYMTPKWSKVPSAIVAQMVAFEDNDYVVGAMRGNWGNRGDLWGTLSGLLVPEDKKNVHDQKYEKTGAWWAHEIYASMHGNLLSVDADKNSAIAVLGRDERIEILLGCSEVDLERSRRRLMNGKQDIDLSIIGLDTGNYLINVQEIPFLGSATEFEVATLKHMPETMRFPVSVESNDLEFTLNIGSKSSAYHVLIEKLN